MLIYALGLTISTQYTEINTNRDKHS
jgi:hypothetical protein